MKKTHLIIIFLAVVLAMVACSDKQAHISIQNAQGAVLATEVDLLSAELQDVKYMEGKAIQAEFSEENKLEEITRKYVGQNLNIYLDDELISSSRIMEVIVGNRFIITGDYTEEQAEGFVRVVNN